jgi:hypothetical protein
MTAGAGGSEFGKQKWLAVLKGGFKTAEEPPKFKLWQLALADHVVCACAVSLVLLAALCVAHTQCGTPITPSG